MGKVKILSVKKKILLIAMVVNIVTIAAVAIAGALHSLRDYEEAMDSRSAAVAKGLVLQLERLMALGLGPGDITGFDDQCEETAASYPGIGYAMVAAPDGKVLFRSNAAPTDIRDEALLNAVAVGTRAAIKTDGKSWHNTVLPVHGADSNHVASIVIGFPDELLNEHIGHLFAINFGVALLVLVAGTAVLYISLTAFVTRPLSSLTTTVLRLQQRPLDLSGRALVSSDDEVGQLGRAFNGLMDELFDTTVSKGELETAMRELRQLSDAFFAQKERAEVTLNSIADAVVTTDAEGRVQYLNPVGERLIGASMGLIVGKTLDDVLVLVDSDSERRVDPTGPMQNKVGTDGTVDLVRRDGARLGVDYAAAQMHDRNGNPAGTVICIRDVSAPRALAKRRAWEAAHDVLTGLINRREFTDRVAVAVRAARQSGTQHVVFFMDLDQFKVVNDTCGHAAGDELLKELAGILKARVRESDALARLGGDEFALLLNGCTLERARLIANDLLDAVRSYRFECKGKTHTVGVSIGIAQINGESAGEEVLSMADAACYWAKEQGRDRAWVYQMGDSEVVARRREMSWVSRIHAAIDQQRFVLYHQRYQALSERAASGEHIEVLLRMIGENGEIIPPGSFIPAAERYNLMPAIDRWVIKTVFANYHQLVAQRGGGHLVCAINLSGTSINSLGLMEFIREETAAHAIPPGSICFEVTETAAINNLREAAAFISQCKEMGFLFALDDFGTGTSSFGYLRNLSVDFLKIDGGFVKNMQNDSIDLAMTETINRVGHIMQMLTIAEYAENTEVIEKLREIGVDYAQGYGVCKPEPLFAETTSAQIAA